MRKPPTSFAWQAGEKPKLLAHSRVKHELIREYLSEYLKILTNVPKRERLRLTLFDGFAGGGSFSCADGEWAGTPLILAEEVISAQAKAKRERGIEFDVDLYLVEKDKKNFDQLAECISHRGIRASFPGRLHLRNDPCLDVIPDVVTKLRSLKNSTHRSIFLLDQTGFNQVPLDAIRTIMQNLHSPEVILTFSVSWLADLANIDPIFFRKVSSLGIREEHLREMLQYGEARKTRFAAQKWIRSYIADYVGAPYNTCFFLRSADSNKDIWLLHFANSWRARDAMMGVHYQFANKAHFYGKPGFDMLGFDPKQSPDQFGLFEFTNEDKIASINEVIEDVPRKIVDQYQGDAVNLLKFFTDNLNDATLTYMQFQSGLALARDNGLIEVISPHGRPRRTARFLSRQDQIIIPKQGKLWSFWH